VVRPKTASSRRMRSRSLFCSRPGKARSRFSRRSCGPLWVRRVARMGASPTTCTAGSMRVERFYCMRFGLPANIIVFIGRLLISFGGMRVKTRCWRRTMLRSGHRLRDDGKKAFACVAKRDALPSSLTARKSPPASKTECGVAGLGITAQFRPTDTTAI